MNDYEKNFGEEKSTMQRLLPILSFLIIVGITIYTAMVWQGLPDQIATHFNVAGEADRYGSKWTLWLLVGLMFLMYALRFINPKMNKLYSYPVKITEDNKGRQFELVSSYMQVVIFESIVLIAFIQWSTINNAIDGLDHLNPIVMIVLVAAMLVSTVIYVTKSIQAR